MELKLFGSKKGIFFTLIAVSLLGIILFSFSITHAYTLLDQSAVVESRVDSMNRFIKEVDFDMQNAIYIAGFRALIGLEDEVVNTGTFVTSTQDSFYELFVNGTIGGSNSSVMENNTFPYWINQINVQANAVGINLSVELHNVSVIHVSPWIISVYVNATLNVSDVKSTANWTQDKFLSSDISIIGFEDPWYAVYTSNNIVKRINMTVYDNNFTTNNGTNTTNIKDHVASTQYANFTGAPSFLMRFEQDFNSSIYGIESFVDKNEVSPYHSCPTETSSVDNIYWRCNNSIAVYKVANWSGFRIDNETDMLGNNTRLQRYMMEDAII